MFKVRGSNKLFGNNLVKFEWVSKISLSKSPENEIRQGFNYTYAEVHYPENNEDFSLILEIFQKILIMKKTMTMVIAIFTVKKKLLSLLLWTTFRV